MERRTFLNLAAGALALGAAGVPRAAWARRGTDKPVKGNGKARDLPAETHGGPLALPKWPHGPTSAAASAMLMFRGNPAHTFYGTGPVPREKPSIQWKHRMNDFETLYYGEPFTWRGTGWTGQCVVYAGYVWIGSQGRDLYCFEAATGTLRWRFRASRMFKGSACLWDNKLYIGNVDDWLRCFDAATGEVLWRLNTGYDLDSSPCVVDGRLYIAGENGHARCLDPHTGEKIWKSFVGGIDRGKKTGSYGSETSPAVVDGEYYCATYDGELWSLSAADGKRRWMSKTGDDTDGSPVVAGSRVFVAAEDKAPYCYAFSRETGEELWRHKGRGGYWSTPAVVGEDLFIGSAGGQFDCLDTATGKERWSVKLGNGTWGSAAVVDGVVVIGDMGGKLHALDAKTGKELWVANIGGRIHSTPVIVDGRIFIGSTDGWFMALGA